MWSHLWKIYYQTNKARKYYINNELAKYSHGDKSVQEYYNGFLTLWHEKDTMVLDTVPTALRPEALNLQEESHINQFLMNLGTEFELVWAALMNRELLQTWTHVFRRSFERNLGSSPKIL